MAVRLLVGEESEASACLTYRAASPGYIASWKDGGPITSQCCANPAHTNALLNSSGRDLSVS